MLGCSFDGAGCLVCELCRLMVVWVDYRYYLFFVFLGGARYLYLSACNTASAATLRNWPPNQHRPAGSGTLSCPPPPLPAPRLCLVPSMASMLPSHMFTSLSQQMRLPPPRTWLRLNTPQLLLPTHVPTPLPPVQLRAPQCSCRHSSSHSSLTPPPAPPKAAAVAHHDGANVARHGYWRASSAVAPQLVATDGGEW